MIYLIYNSFYTFWKQQRRLLLLIFFGIMSAFLTFFIMFSYIASEQRYNSSWNTFTTYTILPNDSQNDLGTLMQNYLDETTHTDIVNVLWVSDVKVSSVSEEDMFSVVGWRGLEPHRWFGMVDGRFFTAEEIESDAETAYISKDFIGFTDFQYNDYFSIDAKDYEVIGTGFMGSFTLYEGIYAHNPRNNMPINEDYDPHNMDARHEVIDTTGLMAIVPYRTFLKYNFPVTMARMQFATVTPDRINSLSRELEDFFSGYTVVAPESPFDYFAEGRRIMMFAGFIVVLISMAAFISLYHQWITMNRKQYGVYLLCGASRSFVMLSLVFQWLILLVAGFASSILAFYIMFPLLSLFNANIFPTASEMGRIFFAMIAITSILNVPSIRRLLKPSRSDIGRNA